MPPLSPISDLLDMAFRWGLALHVAGMAAILLLTRGFMRRAVARDTPFTPENDPVPAAVIIPVGEVLEQTEPSLRSLLEQDRPNHRVIFATETDAEEAAVLIRRLCAEYAHASHVVAGTAERCSQKNHNLLAAVAALRTGDDVLVFCDSTHRARPDFLARLVKPVAEGAAPLASGYRFVRPGDDRTGTLFQMLAVQSIHMLYAIRPLSQPWGGATAISREVFFENRIPDLWSRTVSDDYSMGPHLTSLGIRSFPVAEACLETHLKDRTVGQAADWFYRQLQIFKFYTPISWAAASILPLLYLSMVAYMAVALVNPATGGDRPAALLYLASLVPMGLWYTSVIPNPAPAGKRLTAFFLFILLAPVQLLRTWTSNVISWQGVDYHMALGGGIDRIVRRTPRGES